jgi:hypothetical protein
MFLRRRQRVRLCLLVLVSLLFQHVALAAYACAPAPASPPSMPAGMEHCAAMAAAPAPMPATALCEKHCSPDQTVVSDSAALHVPALAASAVFLPVLDQPRAHALQRAEVPIARSDPPPRLRYCSLLI